MIIRRLNITFSFLTLLSSLVLLNACSNSDQTFKKAPVTSSDLGLITKVSKENKDLILASHPEATVRTLNAKKGFYEFKGLTKKDILDVQPNTFIEENSFIINNIAETPQRELHQEVFKNQEGQRDQVTKFLESCTFMPFLKSPSIHLLKNDLLNITFPFAIEDQLKFEVQDPSYTFMWFAIPPLGSNIEPTLKQNSKLSMTFDMVGTFKVALYYQKNGFCNQTVSSFPVTANIPYKKHNSSQQSLSNHNYVLERAKEAYFYNQDIIELDKKTLSLRIPFDFEKENVVAVIDTGMNYNHPLLNGKVWINDEEVMDGLDNDGNGYIDDVTGYDFVYGDAYPYDDTGHGTHVSGLIAGEHIGVSPKTKIMSLKAVNGINRNTDTASLAAALMYALDKKAKIINLSVSSSKDHGILKQILNDAKEEGVLIVSSAGNENSNNDKTPHYPTSYKMEHVLSVASSKGTDKLTSYSNYGPESVGVAAPGGYSTGDSVEKQILSASLKNPKKISLQPLFGTSMAAPQVSGLAALLLQRNPGLSPIELIEIISSNSTPSRKLKEKIKSGGVINVKKSLESLETIHCPVQPPVKNAH